MDEFENHKLTEGQKVVLGLFAVVMIFGLFVVPIIIIATSTK